MNCRFHIPFWSLLMGLMLLPFFGWAQPREAEFDFFGEKIRLSSPRADLFSYNGKLTEEELTQYISQLVPDNFTGILQPLKQYRKEKPTDDWVFYQLIRKTAEWLSPKYENYTSYTLCKWYLLSACGYNAKIKISENEILLYIQSDELIYNIPVHFENDEQFVCLNIHDYPKNSLGAKDFHPVSLPVSGDKRGFSYKVTQLPAFGPLDYQNKTLVFNYNQKEYTFTVRLNSQIQKIFRNYPVLDYSYYFERPLSRETYSSLIASLKEATRKLSTKQGVDYLMHFTRYAFLYEKDTEQFGGEKRLSPEETLLYASSDCEDRAALFFYLIKEIYDLPMVVVVFPQHVTVGIQFDKPVGNTVSYQGAEYSICEPTPQETDLPLGALPSSLTNKSYEVVYAYTPETRKSGKWQKSR
jgi:hypothetical protein